LSVRHLVAAALDESGPGAIRVFSMCAGQGRDLITVARRLTPGSIGMMGQELPS
jgi:hypothetical protein